MQAHREALPQDFEPQDGAGHIHLLNTTIIPSTALDGAYEMISVSPGQARQAVFSALGLSDMGVKDCGPSSHVGHESTAAIMTALLGTKVEMDRSPWDGSGIALILQLKGRPPEGRILTVEEIESVGYSWRMLRRMGPHA